MLIHILTDRYIRTGNLIQIIILPEFFKRKLCHSQRQKRIYRKTELIQRISPPCSEEFEVIGRNHQISQPLQTISFEIRMISLNRSPPGNI